MTVDAASILLPLYVYPFVGAWQSLIDMYDCASTKPTKWALRESLNFDRAISYPRVYFTAIVNPHSGPGEQSLPSANYSDAIKSLNALSNVRTIGYVATTWCTKDVSAVLEEIAIYAGWGNQDPSLAMHGIFFDETASQCTPDNVSYLQTISEAVRISDGLPGGFVVHNPGALPDARYFNDPNFVGTADLTVVFEDTYTSWLERADCLVEMVSQYDQTALSCLVHSVPELDDGEITELLDQMLTVGRAVYLTGMSNYTNIDTNFPALVDCLSRLLYWK